MLDFDHTTAGEFASFGRWLWQRSEGHTTHEQTSQFITEALFNEFVLDGDPQLALVRIFRLVYPNDFPPDLRQVLDARAPSALALTGSYGIEEEWCSRHDSRQHKAFSLNRLASPAEFPMFAEVLRQLGVNLRLLSEGGRLEMRDTMGTYFVGDTTRSALFPSQDTFIRPYGIRSALGFGGFIYDIDSEIALYVLIAFSRVPITPDAAGRFFTMQPFVGSALASQAAHTSIFAR